MSFYISTPTVSAIGCPMDPALRARPYAPLGSCVWTSSGDLGQRGIAAIAHAATGTAQKHALTGGEPTRQAVSDSLANAFALCAGHGRAKLAMPFLASGIFLGRIRPVCDKGELAEVIVQAAHDHCGAVQPVIVAFDASDFGHFQSAINKIGATGLQLVQGSIVDHHLHGCDVIVNAANLEVAFGGGLSKSIGAATGQKPQIDMEAAQEVAAFWLANPAG